MSIPLAKKGKIIILSAPSGAGKTTIVQECLKRISTLEFSVSATTRPKRDHEISGRDYYFMTAEKFQYYIDKGSFLEWEEVYPGRYYGTFLSEVQRIITHGHSAVFDVDVMGGLNIKKHYGAEALALFIMPPSVEVLQQRLIARGTETLVEVEKRMAKVEQELAVAPQFDQIILNDNLPDAIDQTLSCIHNFLQINA